MDCEAIFLLRLRNHVFWKWTFIGHYQPCVQENLQYLVQQYLSCQENWLICCWIQIKLGLTSRCQTSLLSHLTRQTLIRKSYSIGANRDGVLGLTGLSPYPLRAHPQKTGKLYKRTNIQYNFNIHQPLPHEPPRSTIYAYDSLAFGYWLLIKSGRTSLF